MHSGNDFYNVPADTPTPTRTLTRTATLSPTRTPTAAWTCTPTNSPTVPAQATATRTTAPLQYVEFCAVADTTLAQVYADDNYGGDALLAVSRSPGAFGGTGQHRYTLLRFDLSLVPAWADIQSATLLLNQNGASGDASAPLSIYALTSAWGEMAATWNNQPGMGGVIRGQTTAGLTPGVVEWDLTGLVQAWHSGSVVNYGLVVRSELDTGQWMRSFSSREASGGVCPRLRIGVPASHPIPTVTYTPSPTHTRFIAPTPTPTRTVACPDEGGEDFGSAVDFPRLNRTGLFEWLCPGGDEDWWKFPAQWGQDIRAALWDLPNDYRLRLIRPDQSLAADSYFQNDNESLEQIADQDGEWRLAVSARIPGSWSGTHDYYIMASVCPGVDEDGQELTSGVPRSGYICGQYDEDWYTFRVPDAQGIYLHIFLSNLPANYDLEFRDPQGVKRNQCNNPGTTNEEINLNVSSSPGLWQIGVLAPHGGFSAELPYQLAVEFKTEVDLTVRRIEVTQAIQRADANSVPLVVGKPALVRVYVGTGQFNLDTIEDVRVELIAWSSDNPGVLLPGSPILLGPAAVPHQTLLEQRLDPNGFSVLLPDSWQLPYGITRKLWLMATVKGASSQPELDQTNNVRFDTAYFLPESHHSVALIQVVGTNGVFPWLESPMVAASLSFMQDLYPISHLDWYVPGAGQFLQAGDLTILSNYGCGAGWNELLNRLEKLWLTMNNVPINTTLYGIIDPSVPSNGTLGCGNTKGLRVAAGILSSENILAHEVGHNDHVWHSPCGDVGEYDGGYPTYPDPRGGSYPSASIGEVGVRLTGGGLQVFDPASTHDIMSYCAPQWVSPYTYWNLGNFGAWEYYGSAAASRADVRQVIAVGEVLGEGTIEVDPLWVRTMPERSSGAGSGSYRIEVQDASGTVLASRAFEPDHHEGDNTDAGLFAETLSYPQGATRVVFSHGGAVLKTVTASAHPPTVTVTYPAGGEVWAASGAYTVTWQRSDADGDPLLSNLLFSRDDGVTWEAVDVDIAGTRYVLNAATLTGGEQVRFRVEVSDGLNTAQATSGPVQVPNKGPLVLVLSPREGTVITPGSMVLLRGTATDREDGPLSSARLSWASDRDGALGTGDGAVAGSLSRGWHTLTAEVHDSAGLSGSASVRVLVGQRMWLPAVIKRR